jgi:hypothetical protein
MKFLVVLSFVFFSASTFAAPQNSDDLSRLSTGTSLSATKELNIPGGGDLIITKDNLMGGIDGCTFHPEEESNLDRGLLPGKMFIVTGSNDFEIRVTTPSSKIVNIYCQRSYTYKGHKHIIALSIGEFKQVIQGQLDVVYATPHEL